MRKPVLADDDRTWVKNRPAALVLDIGNAIYTLMLQFLTQVYSMEGRTAEAKKTLLESAFGLMHSLGKAGSLLTLLPANPEKPGTKAGLSFALERHFNSLELKNESMLLQERLDEIIAATEDLLKEQGLAAHEGQVKELCATLQKVRALSFAKTH
jgi:hypothetical protein